MMKRATFLIPFLTGLVVSCSGEDRVVPFGQREAPAEIQPETEAEPSTDDERPQHRVLRGESNLRIEGAPFSHGGYAFRAIIVEDIDGDGDRDVIALGQSTVEVGDDGSSQIEIAAIFGRREGRDFTTRVIGMVRFPAGVSFENPTGTTSDDGTIRLLIFSAESNHGQTTAQFVVEQARTPRLLESVSVVDGTITLSYPDLDEDGHADLEAAVRSAGATVRLRWLDRPGGLSLDQDDLRRALNDASPEGRLRLAAAWCGDKGQVAVRGHFGLDCDQEAQRFARAHRALIHGEQNLIEGLRAVDELRNEDPEGPWAEVTRRLCRANLERRTIGPAFDDDQRPALRYQSIVFDSDGRLYDALRNTYWPTPPVGEPTETPDVPPEPSSAEAVVERPVPYPAPDTGALLRQEGEGAATRLITSWLAGETIPLPAPIREWHALGWAPQGLVLFDGAALHLLPVTATGSGAIRPLVGPPPTPLMGSRIRRDGSAWAVETPHGVLVHQDRPELWCGTGATPLAIALAPRGERIAVADADGIHLWDVAEP